jgi:serine/threonine protein kinase
VHQQLEIKPGTTLEGRYEILSLLGEGGFARVYLAFDTELSRKVAIKVLKQGLSEATEEFERYKRESKALAQMQHPNIISVLSCSLLQDATPMIVMEYLEGKTLKSLILQEGKIKVDAALSILLQVLDALSYAHSAGLIHRDLTPTNIFLVKEADELRVKLLDFGLSKMMNDATLKLTKTGQILGSPPYMSPEQARGMPLDSRSDIYSFGCVMYELLCGRQAFVADSAISIIYMQQGTYPPDPDFKLPDKSLEKNLQRIIVKCLQKEPAARFATCSEVKDALSSDKLLEHEATTFKTQRQFKQSKLLSITVLALMLLVFSFYFSTRQSKTSTVREQSPLVSAARGEETSLEKVLQKRIRVHGEESLILVPDLEALGDYYENWERYDKAVYYREKSLKLREKYYGSNDEKVDRLPPGRPCTVKFKTMLCNSYFGNSNFEKCKKLATEVIEQRRKAHNADNLEMATLLTMLGKSCSSLNQFQEADGYFEEADKCLQEHRLVLGSAAESFLHTPEKDFGKYNEITYLVFKSDVYFWYGRNCLALRHNDEARPLLKAALQLEEEADSINKRTGSKYPKKRLQSLHDSILAELANSQRK